jgi:DNA repair protein RecO (recombination protein O)
MPSYKTLGVVLKSQNYGEAGKILTVFTERFGKIKVMAKGIRKIKSHLAGTLEPFMLLNMQLHEGKTFYIITSAQIEKDFPNVHTDIRKTAQAFFLGELIDKFLQDEQKMSDVFMLFISSLESLENSDRILLIRAFELKLVEALGFKPELYSCIHCKEKITPENNFWDAVEGGIICNNCQTSFHHGHKISDETIKLLRFMEQNDLARVNLLRSNQAILDETEELLGKYIKNILERELKSERFLKML